MKTTQPLVGIPHPTIKHFYEKKKKDAPEISAEGKKTVILNQHKDGEIGSLSLAM